MNRYRLKICKGDEVRFVSHLDLMKSFERALRRGDIPIAYSEGFNPHPKVSFGSALPVGVTSACELVDLELREELSVDEVKERLNSSLPPGIRISSVEQVAKELPALMAEINRAEYEVYVQTESGQPLTSEELQKGIEAFLGSQELKVEKRTKKGLKEVDIRPGVFELSGRVEGDAILLQMILQTGSSGNIRAEDVLAGLNKLGLPLEKQLARVHRTQLFIGC